MSPYRGPAQGGMTVTEFSGILDGDWKRRSRGQEVPGDFPWGLVAIWIEIWSGAKLIVWGNSQKEVGAGTRRGRKVYKLDTIPAAIFLQFPCQCFIFQD